MVKSLVCAVALAFATHIYGQQFNGFVSPYELLGLSDACFAAVNTTVASCPAWLPEYSDIEYVKPSFCQFTSPFMSYDSDTIYLSGASVEILPSAQLSTLCESSCIKDLKLLRNSISTACTKPSDVMVPHSVAYPRRSMNAERLSLNTEASILF